MKTFIRSTIFSIITLVIYFLFVFTKSNIPLYLSFRLLTWPEISQAFSSLIAADFASLFIVRRALSLASGSLSASILMALLGGVAVIFASIFVCTIISVLLLVDVAPSELLYSADGWQFLEISMHSTTMLIAPAMLVHLWLPLFIVGATINAILNAFLRAVGFAQWFIRRGNDHPFEAIGITATALVFIATLALKGIGLATEH